MTEKVSLHRDDLNGGVKVETGKAYEYKFGEPKGEIHVVVCDHEGHDPLPDQDYEISGPHGVSFKGKTGPKGEIDQAVGDAQVPIDHYTLKVCEQEVKVDSRFPGFAPVHVRIPGMPKGAPPTPPPPEGGAQKVDRQRVSGWYFAPGTSLGSFIDAGWVDSIVFQSYAMVHPNPPASFKDAYGKNKWPFNKTNYTDDLSKKLIDQAHEMGIVAFGGWYRAVPMEGNQVIEAILSNKAKSDELQTAILACVDSVGWDGVDFDVENIASGPGGKFRDLWTQFLHDLADKLHAKGKLLTVTVPGKTCPEGTGGLPAAAAHDWPALAAFADWLNCMAYGTKNEPIPWQKQVAEYGLSAVGADKFILGIDHTQEKRADMKPRRQIAKDAGCGYGQWTLTWEVAHKSTWPTFKQSWHDAAELMNGGKPEASFKNQPKQTPDWFIAQLNKKSPPAP